VSFGLPKVGFSKNQVILSQNGFLTDKIADKYDES
jgi:hypothetical protein